MSALVYFLTHKTLHQGLVEIVSRRSPQERVVHRRRRMGAEKGFSHAVFSIHEIGVLQ